MDTVAGKVDTVVGKADMDIKKIL
ncbi:Protein of unknown function [Bacillus wiedmannii]|nr:Protein of unknown function [Bacillus wiedmannii]